MTADAIKSIRGGAAPAVTSGDMWTGYCGHNPICHTEPNPACLISLVDN